MPFADINGTSLFYEFTGEGPSLALLNGIMMSTGSWALQTPALAPRYRCLLHDFRGQLRSGKERPISMQQHALDLAALLDSVGIDALHVVGTSYGGEVGMEFAIRYPERVKSLVVITAVARPDDALLAKVEVGKNAALRAPETLYDISAGEFFSPEFLDANPALVQQGRDRLRVLTHDFFRGYADLCDSFAALDVLGRLSSIRCPTLVIAGGRDALKPPRFSREIVEAINGARLLVVEDAGHAAVIEKPAAVNTALLEFLSSLP